MKKILISAVVITLLMGVPPSIAKQQNSEAIFVDAELPAEVWIASVSQDLDRKLGGIRPSPRHEVPDGLVQVRFEVQNGEAVNARVFRNSGNRWLDRQAVRSIERLRNIPDIPSAAGEARTVQANIITARTSKSFRKLHDELLVAEQARMASSGPDRTVIAINSGTEPAG